MARVSKKAYRQLVQSIQAQAEAKTDALKIGGVYFLSSFHDQSGAFVKVLQKSKKENLCGWNSSVDVEVVENVNPDTKFAAKYYEVGSKHSVNASNLYEKRELASHQAKFPSFYKKNS